MRQCTIPDCGRKYEALGYCQLHYNRFKKHGNPYIVQRPWRSASSVHKGTGYIVVTEHDHPLAGRQGKIWEHRKVLYAMIGDGEHRCIWCGDVISWEIKRGKGALVVDHLDFDKTNNHRDNLVPSCFQCNIRRRNPNPPQHAKYNPDLVATYIERASADIYQWRAIATRMNIPHPVAKRILRGRHLYSTQDVAQSLLPEQKVYSEMAPFLRTKLFNAVELAEHYHVHAHTLRSHMRKLAA